MPAIKFVKAACAIYGYLLYWVGAWTTCDLAVKQSTTRDVLYSLLGISALLATGTLEFNGGVIVVQQCGSRKSSSISWTEASQWSMKERCQIGLRQLAKALLSMTGSMLCWLGMYSLADYTMPPESEGDQTSVQAYCKYVGSVLIGLVLLFCSGTFLSCSGLRADAFIQEYLPSDEDGASPFYQALLRTSERLPLGTARTRQAVSSLYGCGRALVSIVGQTLLLYGLYCLCTISLDGDGLSEFWNMILVAMVGLLLIACSDSFIHQSKIDDDDAEAEEEEMDAKPTMLAVVDNRVIRWHLFMLYVKCLGVLLGTSLHLTAAWVLVDKYVDRDAWSSCSDNGRSPPEYLLDCSHRNWLFIVIGLTMVSLTHTFEADFGYHFTANRLFWFPSGSSNRQKHVDVIRAFDFSDDSEVPVIPRILIRQMTI